MRHLISLALALLISGSLAAQENRTVKPSVWGIFDGRTPCQELAAQMKEKTSPDCIKIKWRLTLYLDSAGNPGMFELVGFIFKKDKPRIGQWKLSKGTATDPNGTVIELLQPESQAMYFLKADDNILFFLDQKKNLMVGNYDFSYTLNRVKDERETK